MLFQTIDILIAAAKSSHRTIAAWRPYPTAIGLTDDHWQKNPGSIKSFRELGPLGVDIRHHCQRIIISADGSVEGL